MRRTKIFANVGPASANPAVLEGILREGVDIFRFNFSHGTYEQYDNWTKMVEDAIAKVGQKAEIYQDLCGPRLRVGKQPEGGRELKNDQKVTFVRAGEEKNDSQITMTGIDLIGDVKPGERILLANGAMSLVCDAVTDHSIEATVTRGGTLLSNKQ